MEITIECPKTVDDGEDCRGKITATVTYDPGERPGADFPGIDPSFEVHLVAPCDRCDCGREGPDPDLNQFFIDEWIERHPVDDRVA